MAARKRQPKSLLAQLVDQLVQDRRNWLCEVGGEPISEDGAAFRKRLVTHVEELTEALALERIERTMRELLNLPVEPIPGDADSGEDDDSSEG